MSKHTPGPWRFKRCTLGHPDNRKNPIVGTEGNYIARLFNEESTFTGCSSRGPSLEEAEANARLIAAAPEVLEAAELVCDLLERGEQIRMSNVRPLRDAIAKSNEGQE